MKIFNWFVSFDFFFFFQAEDGIRDLTVTGVQTCALPICGDEPEGNQAAGYRAKENARPAGRLRDRRRASTLQREVLRGHKRARRGARVAISMVRLVASVSVVHELPPPIPHAGRPGCEPMIPTASRSMQGPQLMALPDPAARHRAKTPAALLSHAHPRLG